MMLKPNDKSSDAEALSFSPSTMAVSSAFEAKHRLCCLILLQIADVPSIADVAILLGL